MPHGKTPHPEEYTQQVVPQQKDGDGPKVQAQSQLPAECLHEGEEETEITPAGGGGVLGRVKDIVESREGHKWTSAGNARMSRVTRQNRVPGSTTTTSLKNARKGVKP